MSSGKFDPAVKNRLGPLTSSFSYQDWKGIPKKGEIADKDIEKCFEGIKKRMENSCINAIDTTMSKMVQHAKENHMNVGDGWKNVTGDAEQSVNIWEFADAKGRDKVEGEWGSHPASGVHYVIWLELNRGGFMRAASDVFFPEFLGKEIRAHFEKGTA